MVIIGVRITTPRDLVIDQSNYEIAIEKFNQVKNELFYLVSNLEKLPKAK